MGVFTKEKNWNYQNLNITPYVGKLTLVYEEQCLAQRFCKLLGKITF